MRRGDRKLCYYYRKVSFLRFADCILAFNSNPIKIEIELKYSHIRTTISEPIDPYNLLNLPKLFTKYDTPTEDKINNNVATIEPTEKNLQFFRLAGAK